MSPEELKQLKIGLDRCNEILKRHYILSYEREELQRLLKIMAGKVDKSLKDIAYAESIAS